MFLKPEAWKPVAGGEAVGPELVEGPKRFLKPEAWKLVAGGEAEGPELVEGAKRNHRISPKQWIALRQGAREQRP